MSNLLVVGSMAIDSVKTPFGERDEAVGGSATYFSIAASFFAKIRLLAVVGRDFPEDTLNFLRARGVDLAGLERSDGQTFRWKGEYGYDLNTAHTLETRLNVFQSFRPQVPPAYKESEYLFLANIDPGLQASVLDQVKSPRFTACDTMNFWISGKREELLETLRRVDAVVINEAEARELAGESNIVRAARKVLAMGPETVVIKRGEYGALLFQNEHIFSAPGLPLEHIYDPTGAGDSFAGGFMGYLASTGDMTQAGFRRAVIYGSVMASFNVESFSYDRMRTLTAAEVHARYGEFSDLAHFERL
ncbi:MAG: sugar kinase [Candidatus Tectomicrobia bacterium]|uniref:Sugar kinase n=1 Tax=Tectimicrobiota bacterium TaxID=2528274 RepID=A0A932MNJ2_UNCTE|nr:sugar kinase [Candidatus Tectomicrobia bacterium]